MPNRFKPIAMTGRKAILILTPGEKSGKVKGSGVNVVASKPIFCELVRSIMSIWKPEPSGTLKLKPYVQDTGSKSWSCATIRGSKVGPIENRPGI